MSKRIKYLESLVEENTRQILEDKHLENFTKYANYMGNGIYTWRGIFATDTRELFLMGVYSIENVKFKEV